MTETGKFNDFEDGMFFKFGGAKPNAETIMRQIKS